jgi:hypothetical protein
MGVDHSSHVRTHAVNSQVHGNFAGWLVVAAQLFALHIHHRHIFRLHHAFAETGGRNQ